MSGEEHHNTQDKGLLSNLEHATAGYAQNHQQHGGAYPPQQGYPPQGYPPQHGYPPQGYPPQQG
ncbi:hypothetical protein HanPI659440_Chr06g0230791 [Helianthus annuus]|nr:hypothetical protein HanPI659440_Chr06g0230791 [Helianthus annuus]